MGSLRDLKRFHSWSYAGPLVKLFGVSVGLRAGLRWVHTLVVCFKSRCGKVVDEGCRHCHNLLEVRSTQKFQGDSHNMSELHEMSCDDAPSPSRDILRTSWVGPSRQKIHPGWNHADVL